MKIPGNGGNTSRLLSKGALKKNTELNNKII